MRIIRRASLTSTPWKNGGGVTQQVVRVPATGDPFIWRLSLARIAAAGPFSDFTGYARTTVLLEGDGVRLKFLGAHEHLLNRVGDLFAFDGSLAVDCELVGGPCVDLNLFAAHTVGATRAEVHCLDQPLLIPESLSETLLLFAVSGTVAVEGARGQIEILEDWDTIVCAPGDSSIACRSALHSPNSAMLFTARIAEPAP